MNIATDIAVGLLPMRVLRELDLPKRHKIALMIVFGLGGLYALILSLSPIEPDANTYTAHASSLSFACSRSTSSRRRKTSPGRIRSLRSGAASNVTQAYCVPVYQLYAPAAHASSRSYSVHSAPAGLRAIRRTRHRQTSQRAASPPLKYWSKVTEERDERRCRSMRSAEV